MFTIMKPVLKMLLPVVVLLVVAVAGLTFIRKTMDTHRHADVQVGTVMEDFSLTTLDGNQKPLSALGHRIVLINFWATWCDACIVEMPSLVALREKYSPRKFEVLAVSVDENPRSVVPRFIEKLNLTFPIYTDSDNTLSDLFDVHAIPHTVILDQNRKVLLVESGERDWNSESVHKLMEEWLK